MAMAGAYLLANELHQANGNYRAAFQAYQDKLKPEIDQRQLQAQKTGEFVCSQQSFCDLDQESVPKSSVFTRARVNSLAPDRGEKHHQVMAGASACFTVGAPTSF